MTVPRETPGWASRIVERNRSTATAETVLVLFDTVTRRALPLPEETRARLAGLKIERFT